MMSRREAFAFGGAISFAALGEGIVRAGERAADLLPPDLDAAMRDLKSAEAVLVKLYDVERSTANFDAAYYGAMPRPVQAAYSTWTGWVNRHNSLFLRGALGEPADVALDRSRAAVAELLGCTVPEVALCGGGTEALYALITNYRLLKPGDAVIIADIDYDEMRYAMEHLRETRGVEIVRLDIPEPSTGGNILSAYEKVLRDTPRAKLVLLTHMSNRNGLVPPVREIVAMAKARGVDVILDSAQAVGHLDFTVDDTGADFIGFSLHKWIAAPLGTGGIYIRKERLNDIAPYLGNRVHPADDIRARVLTGTVNYAAHLTIPTAIDLHRRLGPQRKLRHLVALRDYWVERVRDVPGLKIIVPDEPGRYGAVTSFRPRGLADWEGARRLQADLLRKHKVLTVARRGLASGPVLRVTPTLFNTTAELDRLVSAIRKEAA